MNLKKLVLGLLSICAAFSAAAAPLQFTNITPALFTGFTNNLRAVAFDGTSDFAAVGDKQSYVHGVFVTGNPWFTSSNWIAQQILLGKTNLNLYAVAASSNLVVATGDGNQVFSAANLFAPGLPWITNHNIFPNAFLASGLAYNGTNFCAVGEASRLIASSGTNLPATTWSTVSESGGGSVAESFRCATPNGVSGFALCGLFGEVRLVTNSAGGLVAQFVTGQVGQPDFYGIAGDGSNTLVCVGATNGTTTANGIIMVSTNNGATFQIATNLLGSGTAFNSVAYTGSGFVAVGNNGQVFTSSKGVVWDAEPLAVIPFANVPSAASLHLFGVTFGSGPLMHDVGEIVGTNGNVIICAPPPPPNVSLGDKATCVGITNAIFENTLQVTNAWGTNIVAVDWFDANTNLITNGFIQITNGIFCLTPPFVFTNTDNSQNHTNIYLSRARDLRTGFVSTNFTTNVFIAYMRPTATLITTNTICNGDSNAVPFSLTGNGPFTVYWTNRFTNFVITVGSVSVYHATNPFVSTLNLPADFASFNPTNKFQNQPTNFYYSVWKLSDTDFPADDPTNLNPTGTNWAGDLTGTDKVTVYPRPTSTSVTTNTTCNGSPTLVTNILTGLGPWRVYWTDGFMSYTQMVSVPQAGPYTNTLLLPNSSFNPVDLFLNAATNHYYWVTEVTDSNCVSGIGDINGSNLIHVNPRPTSTSIATNEICNGDPATITNILTGFGPWTVYWTDGFTNYTQMVSISQMGPVTNVLNLPNSAFSLTNVWPNTVTNHFFWVTLLTDSNCVSDAADLTGTNRIQVDPRPTSASVSTNEICNGDTTVVTNILTGLGPWTVYWTNGTTSYTQAVNVNVVGPYTNRLALPNTSFTLTNANLNQAITNSYWVTAVVSSNLMDGHICTNWASDLTGTSKVIINPRPTSQSISTNEICNGDTTAVTNILTGLGPWTVYWTDGAATYAQAVNVNTAGPYTNALPLPVGPLSLINNNPNKSITNYYWVAAVVSSNLMDGHVCTNWANDLSGTNAITIDPRPTSTAVTTNIICTGNPTTATNILTGLGPWTVYWTDGINTYTQPVYVDAAGPYTNWMALPNSVFSITNGYPNQVITNYYWVTAVVSSNLMDGHVCTNWPVDLAGHDAVVIDPLPTATIIQVTNSYYNLLTFDDLLPAAGGSSVTNGYAGLDWANFIALNAFDFVVNVNQAALVSSNNVVANANGATASITNIVPFDLDSAYLTAWTNNGLPVTALGYTNGVIDLAYSNVYILSTNGPAFIVFNYTNVDRVDFSPSNTDYFLIDNMTVKETGPTEEICNGAAPVFQSVLTGVGPWTVYWTDGRTNYTQTVSTNIGGPYTNIFMVPFGIFNPTNVLPDETTNYVYTITSLTSGSNADMCPGTVLGGSAMVTVSPHPTAHVTGSATVTVTNNSPVTNAIQASLTGFGPWNVYWSDGTNQFCTNSPAVRYVVHSLNVTTNYSTNYVYEEWVGIKANGDSGMANNLYYTNNSLIGILVKSGTTNPNYLYHPGQWQRYTTNVLNTGSGGNARYLNWFTVQTNRVTVGSSLLSATFVYSVTNLTDATGCPVDSNSLTGSAQILFSASSSAIVATGSTNTCLGDPVVISVALSGTPPWTLVWSDGTTVTNVTTTPFTTNVIPATTGWYTNTIVRLTNVVSGTSVASTNITGEVAVYVNPLPTGVPASNGNQTNCAGVPNPALTVTDINSVNWYDANTNLLAANTNSFIPADNTAGVWTYYAAEVNSSGCAGTNFVAVNLVLLPCTNPPAINLSGTNGTIKWFGNLTLEGTTNLAPPTTWQILSNGILGTNVLSFTNGVPPWTNPYYFFRLTN